MKSVSKGNLVKVGLSEQFGKTLKTHLSFSFFVFCFFLFFGCKTTDSISKDSVEKKNSVVIEQELLFEDLEFNPVKLTAISAASDFDNSEISTSKSEVSENTEYKYIFFRLYNPDYSNPFYIANILKGGIKLTLITDDNYSHSAINFSLTDDFYGLTSGGKYQLAQESCVRPKENKYMRHGNPKTSTQVTYALKVSPKEYEYIREFIKVYQESPKVKYNVFLNFQIGFFVIDRKFFTSKSKRQFGSVKYPETSVSKKKQSRYEYVENNFICSTFIAYALENCIGKIGEWFAEKDINYRFVNVPDLIYIPGVTKLFSSTWSEYDIAAKEFVEEYPEFAGYLK